MRASLLLPLALLCALCVLPAFIDSLSGGDASTVLVSAANARAGSRASAAYSSVDDEDDEDDEADSSAAHVTNLRILSAIGAGQFESRGSVSINYNPSKRSGGGSGKALTFSPDQTISKSAIRDLLAKEPTALYRVQFLLDGETEGLVASVPACALVASHFHEVFTFHADPYGTVLSVSYRTPITACLSSEETASMLTGAVTLTPKGKVSFGRPGEKAKLNIRPGFDAASQAAAQAVGAEAPATPPPVERNADGTPVPPPKSFWEKYWIYIVPGVIFMVIQAVIAPQPPQDPRQGK